MIYSRTVIINETSRPLRASSPSHLTNGSPGCALSDDIVKTSLSKNFTQPSRWVQCAKVTLVLLQILSLETQLIRTQ